MAKSTLQKEKYQDLHDLFILKLNSLHYIERSLVDALPAMQKAADNEELKAAFEDHLRETKEHVRRVEKALQLLGEKPHKSQVAAIDGLIEDAQWCIKNVREPAALDALLIAAAQYVERYETAGYGAALDWAMLMEHKEVAELLQATLDEEKAAYDKLTSLAEHGINQRANTLHQAPIQM